MADPSIHIYVHDGPPPGEHDYLSTACHHQLHDRCRLVCKFCDAACRCTCHDRAEETR